MYMNDHFSLTGIPELVPPLNIVSFTTDSITVSWTPPEYVPTGYLLNNACALLCGDPLLASNVSGITTSSTFATFSNIPSGSECKITLAAQYGSASSNELVVTATTMSESEQTISVHVLL